MRLPLLQPRSSGRGAPDNPRNRFAPLDVAPDEDCDPEFASPGAARATEFLKDPARTIIAHNDSPDVGFDASVNPYRGCEHGCIYSSIPRTASEVPHG